MRAIYRNRPNWTTYITYHTGTREAFLHCGGCLSVIPAGEVTCKHCSVKQQTAKANFAAFLAAKEAEPFI